MTFVRMFLAQGDLVNLLELALQCLRIETIQRQCQHTLEAGPERL